MGRSRTGGGGDYELKATFTATADTSGLEAMERKLQQLERRMKRFGKMSATAKVGERGFDDVEEKVDSVTKKLNGLEKMKSRVRMVLEGEDTVENGLGNVEKHLNDMTKRVYKMQIEAKTEAQRAEVDKLGDSADKMTRKARILRIMAQHQGFEAVEGQVNSLSRNVQELSRHRATVHTQIRGHNEVVQGINSVQRNLTELTSRPYDVEIEGDASHAQRVMSEVAAQARAQFARAYRLQVRAETMGFPEAAAQADRLKREMLVLSQQRARVAVELQGASPAIAGLLTVKRTAESAEGGYTIRIDYSRILGAISSLGVLGGAARAASAGLNALGSGFRNAQGGMGMMIRVMQGAMSIVMGLTAALVGIAVVSAGPLVAGFTIAAGAIAAFAGGLGLVAAVAAPVISALSNYEENTKKVETTQKSATSAANALAQAHQQLERANNNVAKAVRSGEQAIASAIEAHEDAVRGVAQARRAYDQALQGVQDAERQGEESIASAVRAHAQAVEAVGDARRNVDRAIQAAADAAIQAEENVAQAVRAHEDAVKGLTYAQEDYEMAAQDSADAQEELTRATQEYNDALATEEQRLLGLRYDLEGLGINQRQLAMDIAEAAKDIRTAENSEERQRAALRYEELLLRQKQGTLAIAEAQRRLQEGQVRGTDQLQSAYENQQGAIEGVNDALRREQRAADSVHEAYRNVGDTAAGITKAQQEGARSIADANDRVADSQRELVRALEEETLAQANIGKARDEAARNVAAAQERVLDAQLAIEDAMRREAQAARGIDEARLQAQEQLNDALQAVADAQRQVAEAAEANRLAQKALNDALSDMPSEKITQLRDAWIALWDDFKARTADAREAIIDFGIELAGLSSGAIPYLADAANATTYALIEGFRNVIEMWGQTGVFTNIIDILGYIPSVTQGMFQGLGGIIGGLINVLSVAMPFIEQFAWYIADVGNRFAAWSNSAEGREQLKRFFESAAIVLPVLWGYIYDIGAALVSWSTQNPEEVLMIVNALAGVVSGVFWGIAAIVKGLVAMETAVPGITKVLGAILAISFATLLIPKFLRTALFDLAKFSIGWTSMGDEAAKGAGKAGTAVGGLGTKLKGIGTAIWGLPAMFAAISAPVWIVVAAVAALAAAAYLIYQNWDWIGPYFWALWNGIASAASSAWSYISGDIYAAGAAVWSFLQGQWGVIKEWWSAFMGSFGIDTELSWGGIVSTISWALSGIASIISTVMPYIAMVFGFAWQNFVAVVQFVWGIISSVVSGGLQIVLGVITLFAGLLTLNWNTAWLGLTYIASGVWTIISGIVSAGFSAVAAIFYNSLLLLENMTGIHFTGIYTAIAGVMQSIWNFIVWVWNGIWMFLFGGSIIPQIVNAFSTAFWTIYSTIASVLQFIANVVNLVMYGINTTISVILYAIDATWNYIWNGLYASLSVIVYAMWTMLSTVFWGIYDTIVAVWDWVWSDSDTSWNELWATLSAIWNGVWSELSYVFWAMWETLVSIWTAVYDATAQMWYDAWDYISYTWEGIYNTVSSWMSDLADTMYDAWYGIWEGVEAFGGWIYDTIYDAFQTAVHTALDFLGTLAQGAADILWYLPGTEDVVAGLSSFAASVDYYANGGIKYAEEGGITTRDRGGIGTDHPHDQVVIWNEQVGNEAWIAENGPLMSNLGYLAEAASWFDMAVVPSQHVAGPTHTSSHREENNKQIRPPNYHSLAGGAGTGDKKKMMRYGGVMYAAHGATLPWGSGLTSQTADTAEKIWTRNNYGSLYYNTYYGHPDGYPEREAYSVDWWDSYRGGPLPTSTGDDIVSQAPGYPDFSYWIWNGADSYDGSIAASDPHYDHAHTTFMPGLSLDSGGGAMNAFRLFILGLIEQLIPDVPDIGDGIAADAAEGTAQLVRDEVVAFIMSKIPAGGAATTEQVREWVEAGIKYGNAFEASAPNIELVAARAMQESTGNPHAINNWDSNAAAGTPSKGLIQIIEPTWEAWRNTYGEDTGSFEGNWMDPIMNVATGTRYMQGRYGGPVGATGFGYAGGGIARGPQIGMLGEGGNELMLPLDDPNAVRLLATALQKTDPVRNRATEYASTRTEIRDNIIQSGVEEVMEVGITGGEALIAEKIDNMKDEIKDEIVASFSETELGDATLDRMVKTAVATALAVVSSRGARDLIDESLGDKLEFDTDMS